MLREHHKKTKGPMKDTIKIGNVVQIQGDRKRANWKLAIVEKITWGGGGMIRSAELRTANGYTSRPINKLIRWKYLKQLKNHHLLKILHPYHANYHPAITNFRRNYKSEKSRRTKPQIIVYKNRGSNCQFPAKIRGRKLETKKRDRWAGDCSSGRRNPDCPCL